MCFHFCLGMIHMKGASSLILLINLIFKFQDQMKSNSFLDCLYFFTSQSEFDKLFNADENSAKEEAKRHVQDGNIGYSNADVVVKLQGWDVDHAKSVAQASLSALKQLILSDKKLPGTLLIPTSPICLCLTYNSEFAKVMHLHVCHGCLSRMFVMPYKKPIQYQKHTRIR